MKHLTKLFLLLIFFIIISNLSKAQTSAWSNKFDNISYGEVTAIAENSSGNLYMAVCRDYTNVYYYSAIYYYNKTTEQTVSIQSNNVLVLKIFDMRLVDDSLLFLCGKMTINNVPCDFVKLNVLTNTWTNLGVAGGNPFGLIYSLERIGNKIYLGGEFSQINSNNLESICSYNYLTGIYDSLPGKLFNQTPFTTPKINVLKNVNNKLFVGGSFYRAGSTILNSVALWNGSNWQSMNNGVTFYYQNATSQAEIKCAINDTLNVDDIYVGGNMTNANNTNLYSTTNNLFSCVMKWNSTANTWDTIPFFKSFDNYSWANGPYNLNSIQLYKNKLYCGYKIGTSANYNGGNYYVAHFSANQWQLLPISFNARNQVSYDKTNLFVYQNELIISKSNTMPINGPIRYNGNSLNFKSFGNGMSQDVANSFITYGKITEDATHVYVANNSKSECSAGTVKNRGIVRFNKFTNQWDSLSTWKSFQVKNMITKNDTLYAVGSNQSAPTTYTMGACWNKVTKTWSRLFPSTTNFGYWDEINDIALYGNGFFIGGNFTINNQNSLKNLAYFNGIGWDSVSKAPFNGQIKALELTHDTLWVGGTFCISSSSVSLNFAAYKISTKQWIHLGQFLVQASASCDPSNNSGEINDIQIYKNKIFVTGYFTKYKNTLGVQQTVNAGAGYFNRGNLAFTPFTDFETQGIVINNFNTSYVESDSIVYLGGNRRIKNKWCASANIKCDSAWAIVRYNYITDKFSHLQEYGLKSGNIPAINSITSFNNTLFITGAFTHAGQYFNSLGVASYQIPYILSNPVGIEFLSETSDDLTIFFFFFYNLFHVQTSKTILELQIYTLRGEHLFSLNNKSTINLSNNSAGIYFLKAIFTDKSQTVRKIIKVD